MSHGLVTINSIVALHKHFGIKSREGLGFSKDGECLLLKGKIDVISYKEEEAPSASGRSTKMIKVPTELLITPTIDVNTGMISRSNMSRIFLQPNPKLMTYGRLQFPTIIEPLTDDKIFCYVYLNEALDFAEVEKLDHFMRLYVLS